MTIASCAGGNADFRITLSESRGAHFGVGVGVCLGVGSQLDVPPNDSESPMTLVGGSLKIASR